MNVGVLLLLLTAMETAAAQTACGNSAEPITQRRAPAKNAYIMRFYATSSAESIWNKTAGCGPLHIVYSDGTDVEIPPEKGRFDDAQKSFSDIQLADDRQHIGWLAEYMICAQSYPCAAELVVYRSEHKLMYFRPPHGIVWSWKFLKGGKQVAVHGGFPHGEESGADALYDTETGRELSKSSSAKGKAPK